MNKNIYIVLFVVIVLGIVFWMYSSSQKEKTSPTSPATVATLSVVSDTSSASAVLSGAKTVIWQTTNYPTDVGVNINLIRKIFSDVLDIEVLETSLYDIPEIINKITKQIDQEFKKGNKVLLHITEGRKITSLALLFAGYMRKEKIEGAYYIIEETNTVLPLPLISLEIGESKRNLLKEISNGNEKIKKIERKLKIKQSAIYQHIQELKNDGYLEQDKELKLTDLGRMMIL